MVAPGLPLVAIHALLNYGPLAIISYKETMEVISSRLDCPWPTPASPCTIRKALACWSGPCRADAVADLGELRRSTRMPATTATYMDAKFGFEAVRDLV